MATKERTKEFTFLWSIKNYNILCRSKQFVSRQFKIKDLSGSKWQIRIYPHGYLNSKYFTCVLVNCNMWAEKININCTMDIIGENNQSLRTHSHFNVMYGKGDAKIIDPLIEIEEIRANIKKWKVDTLTLRCIIHNSKTMTQYEINPRIDFEQCNFLWDVNLSNCSTWIVSKNVYLFGISAFEVTLTAPVNDILISIKRTHDTVQDVNCFIGLCNADGKVETFKNCLHLFDSKHDVWQFPTFITKNTLLKANGLPTYWGTFTLYCVFAVSNSKISKGKMIHADKNPKLTLTHINSFTSLSNDLRCILKNKRHADVNLRVGDKTIPAHKLILSGRSPVFAAMFEQNMTESKTSEFNITDLDIDTVNSFLEFVYTGTVDNMCYESTTKLLLTADKYQVVSLGEKCSNFLISVLSAENACDVLAMADMFRQKLLKEAAFDYIISNASQILSSPEWPQWMARNCELASEIVCKLSLDLRNQMGKT